MPPRPKRSKSTCCLHTLCTMRANSPTNYHNPLPSKHTLTKLEVRARVGHRLAVTLHDQTATANVQKSWGRDMGGSSAQCNPLTQRIHSWKLGSQPSPQHRHRCSLKLHDLLVLDRAEARANNLKHEQSHAGHHSSLSSSAESAACRDCCYCHRNWS